MSDKVAALLEQRGSSWGNAASTHSRIAQVWSGILDTEVTAGQVALCMAGLKLVRASVNPDDPDSFDDAEVYIDIARQCFGLPSKLKPEEKPEASIAASCSNSDFHYHGEFCTAGCPCRAEA